MLKCRNDFVAWYVWKDVCCNAKGHSELSALVWAVEVRLQVTWNLVITNRCLPCDGVARVDCN